MEEHTLQQHLESQFYEDAKRAWEEARLQQIIKGANKYPEPLNPLSWTYGQLVEHGMQENVDQMHYYQCMRVKREHDVDLMKRVVKELEFAVNSYELRGEVEKRLCYVLIALNEIYPEVEQQKEEDKMANELENFVSSLSEKELEVLKQQLGEKK